MLCSSILVLVVRGIWHCVTIGHDRLLRSITLLSYSSECVDLSLQCENLHRWDMVGPLSTSSFDRGCRTKRGRSKAKAIGEVERRLKLPRRHDHCKPYVSLVWRKVCLQGWLVSLQTGVEANTVPISILHSAIATIKTSAGLGSACLGGLAFRAG